MCALLAALLAGALLIVACAGGPVDPAPTTPPSPTTPAATEAPPAEAPGPLTWRTYAPIPTPRSEVAAAVAGGRIYVIAGFGGGNVVERYDPEADSWERVASLPEVMLDHPMAATVRDQVYLLGGYFGLQGGSPRVFRYDAAADVWQEVAPMPEGRGAGGAAAVGDTIYVVGGARDGRLLASVYAYDTRADTWRRVADLPTPRDHLAVAEFRGRVCAVGGRELSMARNLGALECYDPATDTWERLPVMPTPRGGIGAAVVGDALYVVGGEDPGRTFGEVEYFDGTSWHRAPDLPTPRHGLGVAAVDRTLLVLTGGPTPGGSQIDVVEGLTIP